VLLTALRARGRIMLRLAISPEGIAELTLLGWLAPHDCRDPDALADAVIYLADAALAAGLRPGQWRRMTAVAAISRSHHCNSPGSNE